LRRIHRIVLAGERPENLATAAEPVPRPLALTMASSANPIFATRPAVPEVRQPPPASHL